MHLLTVIPVARGIPLDELSYIAAAPVAKGMLVKVPLRSRQVPAIVRACVPAEERKAAIKSAAFSLKTVGTLHGRRLFSEAFMTACEETAKEYIGTTGAIVASLAPAILLKKHLDVPDAPVAAGASGPKGEISVLQAETEERIATYKSVIREEFAKKRSVLMIFPTIQDIELWLPAMERGIGDYTFVFHGGLPSSEASSRAKSALATDHPVLILGTPQALALPRSDIGTIIVERESSGAYRSVQRPFPDFRFAAAACAKASGARLIFGDQFLRIETLIKAEERTYAEFARPKFRILSPATHDLVDLRGSEQPAAGKTTVLSPDLRKLIARSVNEHAKMFILGVRKGYAPITVCGDCGTAVLCRHCSSPVVLYAKGSGAHGSGENFFLCHRCGERRGADERCVHCDSWRLVPLGAGLDRAEEIIRKDHPETKVFRLDRDHVDTHRKAAKVAAEFLATPGSVLLGTEMALPYISETIEYGAILSLQSLLTIPDYQMHEKAFRLIVAVRSKTTNHFLLQTRDPAPEFYRWALQGNLLDCYRSEAKNRKDFHYPPYSVVIKLTYEGGKKEGAHAMEEIEKRFGAYHPIAFPGFIARIKNRYRVHAIMTVPREKWPDPELRAMLHGLPSDIVVQIDPDSMI